MAGLSGRGRNVSIVTDSVHPLGGGVVCPVQDGLAISYSKRTQSLLLALIPEET